MGVKISSQFPLATGDLLCEYFSDGGDLDASRIEPQFQVTDHLILIQQSLGLFAVVANRRERIGDERLLEPRGILGDDDGGKITRGEVSLDRRVDLLHRQ